MQLTLQARMRGQASFLQISWKSEACILIFKGLYEK